MKTRKHIVGITLATAAALAFSAAPITSSLANSMSHQVKCVGVNACKGQGSCRTKKNACKGQNSCKGKGIKMMSSKESCQKAGGTVTK